MLDFILAQWSEPKQGKRGEMAIFDSLFGSKQLIGMDIGTNYIKAVELKMSQKKFKLVSFNYASTPPGVIEHGTLKNIEPLVPVILDLIQKMHTETKKICLSLCGGNIIVKQIVLPEIDDASHIKDVVSDEAEQYIPHDLNNAHLQYHILKNQEKGSVTRALIISAQKDTIFSFLELAQHLTLQCTVIDVASFALFNCFINNYPHIQEDTVVLLNVGSTITNFVVLENGEITFAKDLFIGGDLYNKNLINLMQVSEEEAESLKMSASHNQPVPPDITQIIENTHKTIAEDIKKNFDFYYARSDQIKIQKLFITGGASLTQNIVPFLNKALGIEIEVINPFSLISYDQKKFTSEYISQIAPYASIAIGLAMRYAGDSR